MIKKPKILLMRCSLRSEGRLSSKYGANTDIGLWFSRKGALDYTSRENVKDVRLLDYFDKYNHSRKNIEHLIEKIQEADALIIGTPVYYGFYSSLLQEIYREIGRRRINLFPKIVGFLCAGAKRGGGQTNAIMFAAWDIMKFGAAMVNEGAPLGQFGGNIVAGDKSTATKDSEGIGSCLLLGRRVAEISSILLAGNPKEPVEIQTWDTDRFVLQYKIQRSNAQDECPDLAMKKKTGDYGGFVKDGLAKLHSRLVKAEGVILKGMNKTFMERMRYMRRDDFRFRHIMFKLTMLPQTSVSIKYTAILCRKKLRQYTALYKSGQRVKPPKPQIYLPVGYRLGDKLLTLENSK